MTKSAAGKTKRKVGIDLTEGSIFKCLVLFASPIVLASMIQQLYSVVDLIIIGQFMGAEGTVGVSTGGEISDMVTPIATAFSTAGQIYIAQLVGAKQRERIKTAMGSLITLMFLISAVFMLATLFFPSQILTLINCPEDAFIQARNYMMITSVGIPFIYGYNAICGILRGMGESRAPMTFITIAAVINIVLDLLFVVVFHMEAAGTALATIIAQFASFLAAGWFLYKHRDQFGFKMELRSFALDWQDTRVILGFGVPQAIRSTLVRVSMLWVNASVNAYSLEISATNSVGNKLQKFLDVFSSSLMQASSAMVGQNLGARKQERAGKTVWYTLASTLCICCMIAALTLIFPKQIFGIFTSDAAVKEMGVTYLRIMVWHFVWSAVVSAFQSMVIGSGYTSLNFVIGILDGIVCKIGLSALFAYVLGYGAEGFFIGTAWSRALPAVICFIYFMSGKWCSRKLLTE